MNQDPINQNGNPQNNPYQNPNPYPDSKANPNGQVHFSPSSINLDSLSPKSKLDNLINSTEPNDFQQSNYNPQIQTNDQFGGYNPYQNTNQSIQNFESFSPQDNFDTGFNNQGFNPSTDFNQTGLDQYKSATPQFNSNDPYLMPSTMPENDDLDDLEIDTQEKPQRDTKKILMFGLIGLIVVLLVASLALFFLSQNNKTPAVNNAINSTTGKPTTQGLPATSNTTIAESSADQTLSTGSTSKTGNPNTPASKSVVNLGANAVSNDWLKINFTKFKGALAEDGTCKLQNICGPKADPDKDGLNNLDEFIFGTDPNNPDSDDDGLSDKDELYVYYSDPKNPDTNSNSYKDGTEVSNCYDPNIESQKLSKSRLNEISSNVNKPYVNGLSTITQTTFKAAGATSGELEKGYLTKCVVTSPSDKSVVPKSGIPNSKSPGAPQRQPATSVNVSDGAQTS